MRYIDNVSEVIDFSGETPVTVVSNNVRTYLNQPTVIPHCPDRQSCRCYRFEVHLYPVSQYRIRQLVYIVVRHVEPAFD